MRPRLPLILGLLVAGALAAGWWMSSSKPLVPFELGPPSQPGKPVFTKKPVVQSKPVVPSPPARPAPLMAPPPVAPPPSPAMVEAAPASEPARKVFPPPTAPTALDARKRHTEELEQVGLMLRDYRTLMQENPVGTNAEIMAALMGGNPKHARLGPPVGQALNEHGELLDQWGTPYFFHQMSAKVMEIRSAGPDKRMWSSDDIVVR
jgi:hypothetical protein